MSFIFSLQVLTGGREWQGEACESRTRWQRSNLQFGAGDYEADLGQMCNSNIIQLFLYSGVVYAAASDSSNSLGHTFAYQYSSTCRALRVL